MYLWGVSVLTPASCSENSNLFSQQKLGGGGGLGEKKKEKTWRRNKNKDF